MCIKSVQGVKGYLNSFGCFSSGIWRFLILTSGWISALCDSGVNRGTVDFSGETFSSFSSGNSMTVWT